MLSAQLRRLQEFRERSAPKKMSWMQGMLWRLRRDPQGRLVAYECGSVKGSNACVVDFLEEDLVAAVATNSWECCGWKKTDAWRPSSDPIRPAEPIYSRGAAGLARVF
ncbi:MAG TPA: hypothetical protein VGR67_07595 [Candidatus Polarisedimenticolia bacterium]|jgi:hypothetical protein|nr:hypothetical protein [Candidatus Polarisedimenticolia bacterium]